MNVIIVDDERLVLVAEFAAISRVLPKANIQTFLKANDAIEYAKDNIIDIAFLDINIKGVTGLELAQKLQSFNPRTNIIFCTGYSEYSLEALDLYCSGYLMKPITDEKISKAIINLRYPLSEKIEKLKVICFGNFDVYVDNAPIKFKHKKTKDLFAYLIDRRGSTASTKEIMAAIFEDGNKESYIRNLRADLKKTLEDLSIDEILIRNGSDIGVDIQKIDCDFYDYLGGKKDLFRGEYMSQYSFAESTLGWLLEENKK